MSEQRPSKGSAQTLIIGEINMLSTARRKIQFAFALVALAFSSVSQSWVFQGVDYPGAPGTGVTGINNLGVAAGGGILLHRRRHRSR